MFNRFQAITFVITMAMLLMMVVLVVLSAALAAVVAVAAVLDQGLESCVRHTQLDSSVS